MNWEAMYLEKIGNLSRYVYWRKKVGKSSNIFDQLLIYWKIQVSRMNLSMQCSGFNLTFENVIYHPITNTNCNNVLPPELFLYCDSPGVVREEEQPYIVQFLPGIIN